MEFSVDRQINLIINGVEYSQRAIDWLNRHVLPKMARAVHDRLDRDESLANQGMSSHPELGKLDDLLCFKHVATKGYPVARSVLRGVCPKLSMADDWVNRHGEYVDELRKRLFGPDSKVKLNTKNLSAKGLRTAFSCLLLKTQDLPANRIPTSFQYDGTTLQVLCLDLSKGKLLHKFDDLDGKLPAIDLFRQLGSLHSSTTYDAAAVDEVDFGHEYLSSLRPAAAHGDRPVSTNRLVLSGQRRRKAKIMIPFVASHRDLLVTKDRDSANTRALSSATRPFESVKSIQREKTRSGLPVSLKTLNTDSVPEFRKELSSLVKPTVATQPIASTSTAESSTNIAEGSVLASQVHDVDLNNLAILSVDVGEKVAGAWMVTRQNADGKLEHTPILHKTGAMQEDIATCQRNLRRLGRRFPIDRTNFAKTTSSERPGPIDLQAAAFFQVLFDTSEPVGTERYLLSKRLKQKKQRLKEQLLRAADVNIKGRKASPDRAKRRLLLVVGQDYKKSTNKRSGADFANVLVRSVVQAVRREVADSAMCKVSEHRSSVNCTKSTCLRPVGKNWAEFARDGQQDKSEWIRARYAGVHSLRLS